MRKVGSKIAILLTSLVLVTGACAQQTDIRVNGTTVVRVKPDSVNVYKALRLSSTLTNTAGQLYPTTVSGPLSLNTSTGDVTIDYSAQLFGEVLFDSAVVSIYTPNRSKIVRIATVNTGFNPVFSFPTINGGTFAFHDNGTSFSAGSVGYYNASGRIVELPIGTENYVYKVSGGVPAWRPDSTGAGGGITTLNTLTAGTQTFATGTSGSDFAISSATSTHTFNLPTASASNRGALASADWTTFNNKVATTRTLTMNSTANQVTVTNSGSALDLSANRSWTYSLPDYLTIGAGGTGVFTTADSIVMSNAGASGFAGTLHGATLGSARNWVLPNASGTIAVSATSPLSLNATTGALTLTTVGVASGGTGAVTLTGILQGNGTSAITGITNSSTTGQTLRVTGASTYAWGALDVANTSAVTGILDDANGGTSNAFFTVSGPATSSKTYTFPNASTTVLTTNALVTGAQGGTNNGFFEVTGPATSTRTFTFPNASATVLTTNALVTGAQGGTNNGFTEFTGPATSTKTFTLPNATSTILTSNAAVTVAQGGTGLATLTSGSLMVGAGTSNVTFIAPGTSGNFLKSNGSAFVSTTLKDTIIKAFAFYNVSAADSALLVEVPSGAASWTVKNIRAVRVGGTAATINIRNVTDAVGIIDNYAVTTTMADADASINNPTLSASDILRVELISITGTVQELFIQIIAERPL
jgi:hypothetical protein